MTKLADVVEAKAIRPFQMVSVPDAERADGLARGGRCGRHREKACGAHCGYPHRSGGQELATVLIYKFRFHSCLHVESPSFIVGFDSLLVHTS